MTAIRGWRLHSQAYCFPETDMRFESAARHLIRLAHCLVIGVVGCTGPEAAAQVPDSISGVVVDASTGAPLKGAEVGVDINEKREVPFIGPEGTPRPMYRRSLGVRTDANGSFYLDLRAVKTELGGAHPNERWVMHRIHVYKNGYLDHFEAYTAAGQIFKLKRE